MAYTRLLGSRSLSSVRLCFGSTRPYSPCLSPILRPTQSSLIPSNHHFGYPHLKIITHYQRLSEAKAETPSDKDRTNGSEKAKKNAHTTAHPKSKEKDRTSLVLSLIGIMCATYIGWKEYVYQKKTYHETVDEQGVKSRAMTAIQNSKYERNLSDIHPFIERAELESQLKMQLFGVDTEDTTEEKSAGFISTVVVSGPRGCGKSVLIASILKDMSAVVPIFFNGKDDTDFANAVFQSLSISLPANADPVTFLRDILQMLPKRPIFVVEVDKKFPSQSLEELLLLMKQLGDDSKLVKPIVVLSSSHSALGLNIGITKLRAKYVTVTDITYEESQQFLHELLSSVESTVDEEQQSIDFALEKTGTRLVDLHTVAESLRSSKKYSLKEFQSIVMENYKYQMLVARLAFKKFKNHCPGIENLKTLEKLTNTLPLYELCDELKISMDDFIKVNYDIEPRMFFISPIDFTVSPESHFVRCIIEIERAKLKRR